MNYYMRLDNWLMGPDRNIIRLFGLLSCPFSDWDSVSFPRHHLRNWTARGR